MLVPVVIRRCASCVHGSQAEQHMASAHDVYMHACMHAEHTCDMLYNDSLLAAACDTGAALACLALCLLPGVSTACCT